MRMLAQRKPLLLLYLLFISFLASAQGRLVWNADGQSYFRAEDGGIARYAMPGKDRSEFISKAELTAEGNKPMEVRSFSFSADGQLVLLYTNTRRVWRLDTRGDYYVFSLATRKLTKLGAGQPEASLMFAKISPDGKYAAYVSEHNLYMTDLTTGKETAITTNGTRRFINGTFDWVYEEEFNCRDGFQWSPDSKHISYWQVDATQTRDYNMINLTDSAYSRVIPVEYPTIGQKPSAVKIGVYGLGDNKTTWLNIPGVPNENFLPRMEWASAQEIMVQQLNRRQQQSNLYLCNAASGEARMILSETDKAWIDVFAFSNTPGRANRHQIIWVGPNKDFLWMSERDGWAHLYRISKDGSKTTLLTKGDFDVMDFAGLDEKNGWLYYYASPTNATQQYLYRCQLDGKGKQEKISSLTQEGWHDYTIAPNGHYAEHSFSNANNGPRSEWVDLWKNKPLDPAATIDAQTNQRKPAHPVEFFKVTTADGVEMDGWMVKPVNFDATKKYPVLFYVYTEPASQTVLDRFGAGRASHYVGDLAADGYLYISIDGRGTPGPKGSAWRKSLYRNIGQLNVRDQAMAAKEILKWPYVDANRIAVWGWSGGGSTTLNLLFQYPEIYQTGISVAAVANQLTYDNIYQERYMGLPSERMEDIMKGSPITHAKNLKGNLLYIHGTGDDNVHYNNAEMLLNELIKHNKQFQFMAYPNRSHGISEGEGTYRHMSTLFTEYLKKNCPPGPRP